MRTMHMQNSPEEEAAYKTIELLITTIREGFGSQRIRMIAGKSQFENPFIRDTSNAIRNFETTPDADAFLKIEKAVKNCEKEGINSLSYAKIYPLFGKVKTLFGIGEQVEKKSSPKNC